MPKLHEYDVLTFDCYGTLIHTAQSLFHDHVPAQELGLATAWIDRRHDRRDWGATPPPPQEVRPDFRFPSLGDMAAAHLGRGLSAPTGNASRPSPNR